MDITKYKAAIKSKQDQKQKELFALRDQKAKESKPSVLRDISKQFPLFWDFFGSALSIAAPVWLNTGNAAEPAMGNPGVLLDGLIFAPYRDSKGYLHLNVAIYAGYAPAKEIGLIPKGREEKLANYVEQLNELQHQSEGR